MFLIYSLLYTIAIIILILPQYLKRPKVLRKKWLNEKLGFLPATDSALWVHAVSVGEVNASVPLLRKMKSEYPRFPIILSTITDTGLNRNRDRTVAECFQGSCQKRRAGYRP
jgi:3-deoxy-D-manno-octulosonic-acid transferase